MKKIRHKEYDLDLAGEDSSVTSYHDSDGYLHREDRPTY